MQLQIPYAEIVRPSLQRVGEHACQWNEPHMWLERRYANRIQLDPKALLLLQSIAVGAGAVDGGPAQKRCVLPDLFVGSCGDHGETKCAAGTVTAIRLGLRRVTTVAT